VLAAISVKTPWNARSIALVTRLIGPLLIATSAIMPLNAAETSGRESSWDVTLLAPLVVMT
jgi:hypothetical protein